MILSLLLALAPHAALSQPSAASDTEEQGETSQQEFKRLVEAAYEYCQEENDRFDAKIAQVCSRNTSYCAEKSGADPERFRECARDRGVRI